jgi:hypothetical protein
MVMCVCVLQGYSRVSEAAGLGRGCGASTRVCASEGVRPRKHTGGSRAKAHVTLTKLEKVVRVGAAVASGARHALRACMATQQRGVAWQRRTASARVDGGACHHGMQDTSASTRTPHATAMHANASKPHTHPPAWRSRRRWRRTSRLASRAARRARPCVRMGRTPSGLFVCVCVCVCASVRGGEDARCGSLAAKHSTQASAAATRRLSVCKPWCGQRALAVRAHPHPLLCCTPSRHTHAHVRSGACMAQPAGRQGGPQRGRAQAAGLWDGPLPTGASLNGRRRRRRHDARAAWPRRPSYSSGESSKATPGRPGPHPSPPHPKMRRGWAHSCVMWRARKTSLGGSRRRSTHPVGMAPR